MGKLIISEKVQFELGMEGYSLAEPAMQDGPPHEIKNMSRGGQGGAGSRQRGNMKSITQSSVQVYHLC